MWLLHMKQTDGVVIEHSRIVREYKLPELAHFGVDVFCAETIGVYEFYGCYWHGGAC